jgi:hypothetical protein
MRSGALARPSRARADTSLASVTFNRSSDMRE